MKRRWELRKALAIVSVEENRFKLPNDGALTGINGTLAAAQSAQAGKDWKLATASKPTHKVSACGTGEQRW